MTIFKMDHLHVICNDLEGMIKFWTKGVGATFQENRVFGGADGAIIKLDGLQINLRVPKDSEQGIKQNSVSYGYDHLGLTVDDLDSACSRLAEFGCTIDSGPTELNDRKIVFLKGPENITLELMEMF
jgi:catechol 2,3-dioxygenase-like lactoylglutathione lyase family enzyme